MKYYLLLLSLFAVIVTSCSKKDTPPPIALKSITLGKDTLIMYVGDTRTLSVTLDPSSIDKATLSWNSSDPTVFSVTNAGVLTAHKAGAAILTVGNSGKTVTATALVTVKPAIPAIDSLKVGLIAYYPFDHTSAIDSSGNGHNGTLFNISSVPNRFGKANSAYYFNGENSYVKIADSQDLRLSNTDFTINYWVNLSEYISTSGSVVLSKNNGAGQQGWNTAITGYGFAYNKPANFGHAFLNVSGGPDPFAFGVKVIEIGKWTMVTVSYSLSTHKISFYIDGVLDVVGSNIPSPNPDTDANLLIGKDSFNDPSGLTPPYFIKGKLDDIRMYNRKLTDVEIQKLLNATY